MARSSSPDMILVGTATRPRSTRPFDAMGLAAILLWSSTMACSRHLVEQIDALPAAALLYLIGGSIACALLLSQPSQRRQLRELPARYWLVAGGLFVLYTTCLYLALGLSVDRHQALGVSLLNYLWPGLTVLLSVPILGRRARWWIVPGAAAAFLGAALATTSSSSFSWQSFVADWRAHPLPYLLALLAAVCWGAYSNLTRRLAGGSTANAVPLFLLSTGLILGLAYALLTAAGVLRAEHPLWPLPRAVAMELLYVALFPTFLAYQLWDRAMRRGNATQVACLSYLTPLLSVLIYSLYLHVPISSILWLACALIIAGAVTCSRALLSRPP